MAAIAPMLSSLWFTLLRNQALRQNQFLEDTIQRTRRDLITIFTRILDVYLEGRYLMAGPRGCPEFMVDIWRLRNISLQFCLIVTSPHQIKRRYTWGVRVPWDTRRIWFIGSVKWHVYQSFVDEKWIFMTQALSSTKFHYLHKETQKNTIISLAT